MTAVPATPLALRVGLAVVGMLGAWLVSCAPARAETPAAPLQVTAALEPVRAALRRPGHGRRRGRVRPGKGRRLEHPRPAELRPVRLDARRRSCSDWTHGSMRFRYSLLCVTDDCLPRQAPVRRPTRRRRGHRPRGRPGREGRRARGRRSGSPPGSPRPMSPGRSQFRTPAGPPSPAYRARPGPLAAGLIAAAVLCALAAAVLAGRALARRSSRAPASRLSPPRRRDRVRAGLRQADRHRIGGARSALLAEAVDDLGEPRLADSAAETAWSKRPPTPAGANELADRAAAAGRDRG